MEKAVEAIDKKQINNDILKLVIPSVLENLLQILTGLVVTVMVGRLAADDMSAQGISNRIYDILFAMFRGLGTGATIVGALYFGSGGISKCRRLIEQAYLTGVPLALLFSALFIIIRSPVFHLLTDDPRLIAIAMQYSSISAWAVPFIAIISFNTAAFNGMGDTKTPMYIALVLNVINIAIGYVAIFGVGGIGGWGITGAAVATVASQFIGAAIGVALLYRKGGPFRQNPHGQAFFSIDRAEVKKLYATGVPAACENAFWQLSTVVMSKVLLGSYGSNTYAAYQQGLQAEMITEMMGNGFIISSTTLSARAIGQRKGELYRGYYRQMNKMALIVSIAASALLLLFPMQLMKVLTDKPELQHIGARYIFLMGFTQVPQMFSKVYNGFIRSSGGKRVPMYIAFSGIWLVRVPLVILVGWFLKLDITYIWMVLVLDQISRLIMSVVYARKKDIRHYIERLNAIDASASPPRGEASAE